MYIAVPFLSIVWVVIIGFSHKSPALWSWSLILNPNPWFWSDLCILSPYIRQSCCCGETNFRSNSRINHLQQCSHHWWLPALAFQQIHCQRSCGSRQKYVIAQKSHTTVRPCFISFVFSPQYILIIDWKYDMRKMKEYVHSRILLGHIYMPFNRILYIYRFGEKAYHFGQTQFSTY